jgi:serine/threonine-protein kinase
MGTDVLLSDGAALRLDAERVRVDTIEFEKMRASGDAEGAASLYAGRFLDGLALPNAVDFEHWEEVERDRLEHCYQDVLEQLAEQSTMQGACRRAVFWWRQRLARTPQSGRAVMHLMRALEKVGDRADALHVAEVHRLLLRREFDARPDPDVTALAAHLRHGTRVAQPVHANFRGKEPDSPRSRIAVLPFEAIPSELENDALALGMTEEIIAGLSRIDGLSPICRTSVMQYRGTTTDARRIGTELRVGFVVEGTVRISGERVRVTVRLVDTESERLLWTNAYDRTREDLFTVQNEVAEHVALELGDALSTPSRSPPVQRRTVEPAAYREYMLGRYFLVGSDGQAHRATGYLESATDRDPTFVEAHAALGLTYLLQGVWGIGEPKSTFPLAKASAMRALQLDPSNWAASNVLAAVHFHHEWDWVAADRQFQIARQQSAEEFVDSYLAFCLVMGRGEEAMRVVERGLALDPLSPVLHANLTWVYTMTGRYDDALRCCSDTIARWPDHILPRAMAGAVRGLAGAADEAAASAAETERMLGPDPVTRSMVGWAYASAGRTADAQRIIAQLREIAANRYVDPFLIGIIHGRLGELDTTFECLERGFSSRGPNMAFMGLNATNFMEGISGDPRFTSLLERMQLAIPCFSPVK